MRAGGLLQELPQAADPSFRRLEKKKANAQEEEEVCVRAHVGDFGDACTVLREISVAPVTQATAGVAVGAAAAAYREGDVTMPGFNQAKKKREREICP